MDEKCVYLDQTLDIPYIKDYEDTPVAPPRVEDAPSAHPYVQHQFRPPAPLCEDNPVTSHRVMPCPTP
uniref:Uncharacterized protein n=1 Tax=Cucumis melo TaxID=3656 RepID=A0A9I9D9I0_CUCME